MQARLLDLSRSRSRLPIFLTCRNSTSSPNGSSNLRSPGHRCPTCEDSIRSQAAIEGTRERVQVFKGVVIRRQGGGVRETFTVRKVSFGVGVERTFPVHTPTISLIEVATRGDVRRAKLYYLRDLRGKAAKIKEKR